MLTRYCSRDSNVPWQAFPALGLIRLPPQTIRQLVHDPGWDRVALSGIDESEHHEVGEEDAPIPAEPAEQAVPIEAPAALADDVSDVGSIEPLALHDVSLRPDDLLGGAESHRDAE